MSTIEWIVGVFYLFPLGIDLADAAELPAFQQGMWEFERTVGLQKFAAKDCLDPRQEMKLQNASLEKMGCKVSPVTQNGATYTFTTDCVIKLPSTIAMSSSTSTLTVESETAYRLEIRSVNHGQVTEETISAHRVASCNP
jgi:Protein of unknown function (DUF3617)